MKDSKPCVRPDCECLDYCENADPFSKSWPKNYLKENEMKSQAQEILDYLKQGNSITQSYAAHHFRCWRLAARIYDLRQQGVNIMRVNRHFKSKRSGRNVYVSVYWLPNAHKTAQNQS